MVTDPYVRVGRQDLTADVDFQALDHHGRRAGFETVLYTMLAGLLRADGADRQLEKLLTAAARPTQRALRSDRQASALEQLLDQQGRGGAEGDDVGQRIQIASQIRLGLGQARHTAVEGVEHQAEADGERGQIQIFAAAARGRGSLPRAPLRPARRGRG